MAVFDRDGMLEAGAKIEALRLVGGALCLDFTNTAGWHASNEPHEWLTTYADLVEWSRGAGVLDREQAEALHHEAVQRPDAAAGALRAAIALRETLYRIFSAVAAKGTPDAADLDAFNRALREALAQGAIMPAEEGFEWVWEQQASDLEQMLAPILHSAAELLLSTELERVRECGGPGCGWLFVDRSRNRSRRWCAMDDCGNRAKARRHYRRKSQAGA